MLATASSRSFALSDAAHNFEHIRDGHDADLEVRCRMQEDEWRAGPDSATCMVSRRSR
jgi:hypothetical protein